MRWPSVVCIFEPHIIGRSGIFIKNGMQDSAPVGGGFDEHDLSP
jgi:hypothetical protein